MKKRSNLFLISNFQLMLLNEEIRDIMKAISFNTVNMEVFIPPKYPFKPQLIFIPNVGEQQRPNCEDVQMVIPPFSRHLTILKIYFYFLVGLKNFKYAPNFGVQYRNNSRRSFHFNDCQSLYTR